MRGPSVRDNYRRIGGGSPQLRITREQAQALEDRLNFATADTRYRVFIAMRYSRPSADDALEAIAAAGIRRIVTLTLFPHWSKATTGSSRNEFERVLASAKWKDSRFEVREAVPAELNDLLAVHPEGYLVRLEEISQHGGGVLFLDTVMNEASWSPH